ncbi:hypothetical protein NCCP691_39400 [Noviherbaspirillum aridicola]|uniref:Response regulator receiver domain-containing protein n=1 Tax=Noviherbaspirillum aridicola TaxID=2849687 RepID=A0ABQ4Q9M6_9BURK|nr:hypothetical protein NCCP691_39400 [Noviherbaspirillum aridicola]
MPGPFSVAVLDSDAYLGDALCAMLRDSGVAPVVFYEAAAFLEAHRNGAFDAYVLDATADWPAPGDLERVVAAIRARDGGAVPVFILGRHAAPERAEGLAEVLMRHRVRYVLRPARVSYIATQVGEELARRAGG